MTAGHGGISDLLDAPVGMIDPRVEPRGFRDLAGKDPERLVEQPYDVQKTLQLFEESNRLYAAQS